MKMPCAKCSSDFNLFNWKIKCGECEDKYCNKCLKRRDGILYCEKCQILLKRPPDRSKLMELKSKDLQDYLNKHNISTYGLVEKQELVDIFCNKHIPERPKRGVEKLTANFAGSLPNLRPLNEFIGNLESVVTNDHNVPRPNRTTTQQQSRPVNRTNRPSTTENSQPTSTEASGSTQQTAHPEATTSSGQETEEQSTTSVKDEEQANDSPLPPKYPKLQDFGSVEELHNLSAKDLKVLLTLNRVDFKGCVEKSELLERAERLWEDTNEQNKAISDEDLDETDICGKEEIKLFEATKIQNYRLLTARSMAHSNKLDVQSKDICVSLLDSASRISSDYICRICHGGESMDDLLTPCRCRGTIALVHLKCLERWLKESNHSSCELCQHHYKIVREPRYSKPWSILVFLRHPGPHFKDLVLDMLAFSLYTPSAIASTYMLMMICESLVKSNIIPSGTLSAHLVAFSAIFGMAAIDFTYSSWLLSTFQKHVEAWREWYKSNSTLKVVLPRIKLRPHKFKRKKEAKKGRLE